MADNLDFRDLLQNQSAPSANADGVGPSAPSQPKGLDFSDLVKAPANEQTGTPKNTALDFRDLVGQQSLFPTPSASGTASGLTRDESDRFTQDDPGDNWVQKAWTLLNKPLTESLFGWGQYRQGAGGVERGFEKIGAGLTSPLSLLTFAAFAPAGVAESVAGSVLKDGLTSGAEKLVGEALTGPEAALKVEQYGKAIQAAQKARIAGKSISGAVSEATGNQLDYQEFLNFGNYLHTQGFKEADMLGESFARRGVSNGLKKVGVTPVKAMAVAKGTEFLVNAGFGFQQIHGAIYAYPRVLDEMQNGDWDDAAEHIVEAGAGTVFGTLGLAHSLHSVNDLLPGVNERNSLPWSDETKAVERLLGRYQGELGKASVNIADRQRQLTLQIMEAAGVEPPASLKTGDWGKVSPVAEISSAWRNIIGDKQAREKVADTQKRMFFALDNGGDRQLSNQQLRAFVYAYHLEPWAEANLPGWKDFKAERTLENIQREEANSILKTKDDLNLNRKQDQSLSTQISLLTQQLPHAEPQDVENIKEELQKAQTERNELSLKLPELEAAYKKAQEWQHPTEETWRDHYADLLNQIREAVKPLADRKDLIEKNDKNALDEFNKAVNVLGINREDLDIIEKEYPQFRDQERDILDKTRLPFDYYPPDVTTWKFAPINFGEVHAVLGNRNYLDSLEEDQVEPTLRKMAEEKDLNYDELKRLTDDYRKRRVLPEYYQPPDVTSSFAPATDESFDIRDFFKKTEDGLKPVKELPEWLRDKIKTPEFKRFFGNSKAVDEHGNPLTLFHATSSFKPAVYEGPKITEQNLEAFIRKAPLDDLPVGLEFQAKDVLREIKKGVPFDKAMAEYGSIHLAELFGGNLKYGFIEADDFPAFDPLRGDLGTHVGSVDQASHMAMRQGETGPSDIPHDLARTIPLHVRVENPLRLVDYGSWNTRETLDELTRKGVIDEEEKAKIASIYDTRARNLKIQQAIERAGFDGVVYLNRTEGIGPPDKGYQGSYLADRNYVSDREFVDRYPKAHDSYIVFHPEQIKSIFNRGTYNEQPEMVLNQIYEDQKGLKEKNELSQRLTELEEHINAISKSPQELEDNREVIDSLLKERKQLIRQFEKHNQTDLGEVHQLPETGRKVAYVSPQFVSNIYKAMGWKQRRNITTNGMSMHPDFVKDLERNLDNGVLGEHSAAMKKLIEHGKNPEGTFLFVDRSTRLNGNFDRVFREELVHEWQHRYSESVYNHLPTKDMLSLFHDIPEGLHQYMSRHGYVYRTNLRVLEAAAKIVTVDDLSQIGTTAEEATDFINKYFHSFTKTYGMKALEQLNYVSETGLKFKEDFLNGLRKLEGSSDEGKAGGAIPPMAEGGGEGTPPVLQGAGGSGGDGEGPPIGPPPEPEWWRKPFQTSQFPQVPWLNEGLHPALPSDTLEKVEQARNKPHTPEHLEYVKQIVKILSSLANNSLSDKEKSLYNALRDADDENWTAGYNKGIIRSIVDNHIHHIWGEKDPIGNSVLQSAGSGAFSINASQAKHRTWGTAFEGILRGRQLKVHDPAAIISHDAHNIAKAAANREVIQKLADSGLKDIEGMPIAVYFGRGFQVSGEDGSDAAILVNPHLVRNIVMQPQEIRRLINANLLDTYLKDGRVVDKTPNVHQGNVKEWIASTQKKLDKMGDSNPLLLDPSKRTQHQAAWGQLELFAKNQSEKIADYLRRALDNIRALGPQSNDSFDPIQDARQGFNMAEYQNKVLHGGTGRKISQADLQRLEEYQKRNEQYAQGLTSRKDAEGNFTSERIRPYEIARILMQEREHLEQDPELKQYMDEVHQTLGTDWKAKNLNIAMHHIAHAAENPQFDQLQRDLADLKQVDRVYTSVNPITMQEHKLEAEKLLEEINARQPKQYLWAPKTHIVVDHPSFHGYKWMATAPDGTPTLAESSMGLSRYYYKYFVNALGLEPSWLRKPEGVGKITSPILKKGAQIKSILLSGSPFHLVQEFLRGLMLGVNPFVRPNPMTDLDEYFQTVRGSLPVIKLGVENNLTMFNNRFEAEDYSVGVASHVDKDSIARKIPLVNHYLRYSDQVHDFLFNRYIPQLKASGFRKMFDKYASAHPDWSNDAVAKAAAEHTNATFGGINWRAMGRSAATQDWFHLLALAPDWLESEMRFAAGAFKGLGIGPAKYEPEHGRNFTREQIAATAVTMWVVARVLNQLYSGSPHFETPFGLATKDKNGRELEFSVRTMPTDMLHMATDPYGFLLNRESPFVRTALEGVTGRNQYDQKLQPSEKYVDLISNLAPIWGQAIGKKFVGDMTNTSDVGNAAQAAKAAGFTVAIHRTPAQRTAANLASERSEEGSMTPATIMRHRLLLQLEDDMRLGRVNRNDLQEMVTKGNLPIADAKTVMKTVQETAGEDQETARMYSRVSRLDWAGALAVWEDGNKSEKAILQKLIIKKANAYIKKAYSDFTPRERDADPLLKRAFEIAPVLKPEVAHE